MMSAVAVTDFGLNPNPGRAEIRRACEMVAREFPFQGYMDARRDAHFSIASVCVRLLPVGARILDYGAGPCDTSAVLSHLGYRCTAIDDLSDHWHTLDGNRERILEFATSAGVNLIVSPSLPRKLSDESFDMIMLHDVIEHFADSPRQLLLEAIQRLEIGGFLYISVPNAVNLRKRLFVLAGRTNYPRFPAYYWSGDTWRGHKREYVKDDLAKLCEYLGLERIMLRGEHHRLNALPPWSRWIYKSTFGVIDSLRETLSLIGRKNNGWNPPEIGPELDLTIRARETPYRYHA
jgi:SAM-dependent methyltransferase